MLTRFENVMAAPNPMQYTTFDKYDKKPETNPDWFEFGDYIALAIVPSWHLAIGFPLVKAWVCPDRSTNAEGSDEDDEPQARSDGVEPNPAVAGCFKSGQEPCDL